MALVDIFARFTDPRLCRILYFHQFIIKKVIDWRSVLLLELILMTENALPIGIAGYIESKPIANCCANPNKASRELGCSVWPA